MEFTYKPIKVAPTTASQKRKTLWRPIIPVILRYGKALVGYEALIDSGADFNVFDAGIALILGITLKRGKKRQIVGIGNQILKGYEHQVKLRISNSEYLAPVIFSQQIPDYSFEVLGNKGFF